MLPSAERFALMLQALAGKLNPREPARPGPSRVHRWLGDEAEDVRTLDGGHHDVPAVTDTGAKLEAQATRDLATIEARVARQVLENSRRSVRELHSQLQG